MAMVINGICDTVSEFEIILVDDGSEDNSREVISSLVERDKRVRNVFHPQNLGKGAALRSGFEQARMEWILMMDADLQIDISELSFFLPYCRDYDIITGYRKGRNAGLIRSIVSKIYNVVVSVVIGVNLRDVGCPFKLLKKTIVDKMHLTSSGFAVDAEIFQIARQHNYRIKESDVKCKTRIKGESTVKARHFIQTFFELLMLKKRHP
jgi:glycosyltransferase involved in cell wall biosynthesis